jgi:ABC-type sugar transport system permease subunit
MADTVDNRPPASGLRPGTPGATDLRPASSRPPGPESPGRRRLSPPAVGARPGQRARSGPPARAAAPGLGGRTGRFIRRYRLGPYLLLLPSLIGIGLILLWPTIQVGLLSFQNYSLAQVSGAAPAQWVGGSNFTTILTDSEFWLALRITVVSAAVVVALTLLVGTLVGLLLHHLGRRMATFVSSAALLAWATPLVSATVIFYWLFSPDGGIADWALSKIPGWLGGGAHWIGFNWTTSGALPAYTVLTVLVVWQSFPFIAVTVLAGLKTIPAELTDAARVDGAGAWRSFWRVTYPLMRPIFLVLLLLSIIWDFGIFGQTYLITGELGNRDEYNLSLYAYDKAFTMPPNYGMGAAIALVLTLILLIITVGYVRASVRQGATS